MRPAIPVADEEDIRRRLAERDVRYTGGRRAVVRAIQHASGPQSAAELHAGLGSVPLSSLYRTLTVLDEAGVIRKHHDAEGVTRYELAEWLAGHHHHLVCLECGAVEDMELDTEVEAMLDELAENLATRAGYRVAGHELEVEGVCASCA